MIQKKIIARISFIGKNFCGWQKQSSQDESSHKSSIQGEIERSLAKIFPKIKERITVLGCGRTDAGVHAREYYLELTNSEQILNSYPSISSFQLQSSLNAFLHEDIRCLNVFFKDEDFHVLRSIQTKTYLYRIAYSKNPPLFNRETLLWVKQKKEAPLEWQEKSKLLKSLIGKKDFACFASTGYSVQTTIREVCSTGVTVKNLDYSPEEKSDQLIEIVVQGKGFLKQMVRNITGAYLEIVQGRKESDYLTKLLELSNGPGTQISNRFCAPAHGLQLHAVDYGEKLS